MGLIGRPTALVTGGSRGIGAEAALALADDGYSVVITFRNKEARAADVARTIRGRGVESLALQCDITRSSDIRSLARAVRKWCGRIDVLVLSAAGGLERDLIAEDPSYPMRVNCEAQVNILQAALPLLKQQSTVIFVTSHWAHFYDTVEQLPLYSPVAKSKHLGELALREHILDLKKTHARLVVVTGDLVEGTITTKLLERAAPDVIQQRRRNAGSLPTTTEMGRAIANAATDHHLQTGDTIVVGAPLTSLTSRQGAIS